MEVKLRFESENWERMIASDRENAWQLIIEIRGTPKQVEILKDLIRCAIINATEPTDFPRAKEE